MADKSDEGAWAVIRYLPFDTSEGELPAHFDGWFTHRDAAEAVLRTGLVSIPKRLWSWWSIPVVSWPREENNRTRPSGRGGSRRQRLDQSVPRSASGGSPQPVKRTD